MRQLGIFAKYWKPGLVKTRLAATEGANRAAELYRGFLATTLTRFSHKDVRRVLAVTPWERRYDFTSLAGTDWEIESQGDGDLGQRITNYFDRAFGASMKHVLLLGSDTPTLPLVVIDEAFHALKQVEVVLGPTSDGGYYLVGLAAQRSEIFSAIDWSTPLVWQQTVDRLTKLGIRYYKLPPWYDVDDRASLDQLREELRAESSETELSMLRQVVDVAAPR